MCLISDKINVETVKIVLPTNSNLILGQTHFIKSVEDLYEAIVNTVPNAKFGIAFCEASGPCLVRCEGNDAELKKAAAEDALKIGCGHSFLIFLRDAYPINVLNTIQNVPEVCGIYCATGNPIEVLVAETDEGRGIIGVIDGSKSKGIETPKDAKDRKTFLRKIGYKL